MKEERDRRRKDHGQENDDDHHWEQQEGKEKVMIIIWFLTILHHRGFFVCTNATRERSQTTRLSPNHTFFPSTSHTNPVCVCSIVHLKPVSHAFIYTNITTSQVGHLYIPSTWVSSPCSLIAKSKCNQYFSKFEFNYPLLLFYKYNIIIKFPQMNNTVLCNENEYISEELIIQRHWWLLINQLTKTKERTKKPRRRRQTEEEGVITSSVS